ncbi:MAG: zinc-binding dehydrogenase, partial [Burkholderiaceae bacterium]|nr:zinc-binding dehydrogenase [Burkholderiaceae bacterium]
ANLDLAQLLRRRLTVTGSTLRPRSREFKQAIGANLVKHVWPLLESGAIKPVIYRSFALEQAKEAHLLMESSAHIGKIMLQVA